jgi:hypothetical protein
MQLTDKEISEVCDRARAEGYKTALGDAYENIFNRLKSLGYDMSQDGPIGKAVREVAWNHGLKLNEEGIRTE